uniref:Uncharacterized protein n=1 Tax=viral metagenome TaxID=1070528 RepID=A0A6M3IXJ6_9ZZZZ
MNISKMTKENFKTAYANALHGFLFGPVDTESEYRKLCVDFEYAHPKWTEEVGAERNARVDTARG